MKVKNVIVISALVAAVALGACRRVSVENVAR
jgi:hypothetical protein